MLPFVFRERGFPKPDLIRVPFQRYLKSWLRWIGREQSDDRGVEARTSKSYQVSDR
jgi:hypothetical protein